MTRTRYSLIDWMLFAAAWAVVAFVCLASAMAEGGFRYSAAGTPATGFTYTEANPWYPPLPANTPPPPPLEDTEPAKAEPKVDQRPIVYRLHATWCGPCKSVEAVLTKAVRAKLPFQIVDWDVDTKGYMGAPTIPAFWWKSPQGNRRVSWSSIEHLVKTWEATQKPPVKATANNGYPAFSGYRPRWTWPRGVNLQDHLRQSHGVSESLTQDQAERLHDALHEGYSLQAIRNHFR